MVAEMCHVHAYVHAWCSTVLVKRYCAYCNMSDHVRDSLCYVIIRVHVMFVIRLTI